MAAKTHVAMLDAAERHIARVLQRVDAVTALIPDAFTRGYLPGMSSSGPIGQLAAPTAMQKNLDGAIKALRIVTAQIRDWRETARFDMRRKRGRKVGDRRWLNAWVIRDLDRERLPIKTNPDGVAARVLEAVYAAAGVKAPEDLYRDLRRAIDDAARDRRNQH